MKIYKNANYTTNNVVRFRGNVAERDLQTVMEKLEDYIESEGAKLTGDIITAIHVLYLNARVTDIEIFVAVDKAIPSIKEFTYIHNMELVNCLKVEHRGSPYLIPGIYTDLHYKAEEMGFEVTQPFYNVSKDKIYGIWVNECNWVEVDIYAPQFSLIHLQRSDP